MMDIYMIQAFSDFQGQLSHRVEKTQLILLGAEEFVVDTSQPAER